MKVRLFIVIIFTLARQNNIVWMKKMGFFPHFFADPISSKTKTKTKVLNDHFCHFVICRVLIAMFKTLYVALVFIVMCTPTVKY